MNCTVGVYKYLCSSQFIVDPPSLDPGHQTPGAGGKVGHVHAAGVGAPQVDHVQLPASLGPGAHHQVAGLPVPGPVGPVQVTAGVQVHGGHPPDLETRHNQVSGGIITTPTVPSLVTSRSVIS